MDKVIKSKKEKKNLDQIKILLNKYYKIINIIIFLFILVVGFYFLILPKTKGIKDVATMYLPDKLEELDILEDYSNKVAKLKSIVEQFKIEHKKEINKLSEVLPSEIQLPQLLVQLERLVIKSGFTLNSITMSPVANSSENDLRVGKKATAKKEISAEGGLSNIKMVNIQLAVTGGNYFEFKKIVSNIEEHIRLLDIISVSFSSAEEGSSYNLNLRTYYLPE